MCIVRPRRRHKCGSSQPTAESNMGQQNNQPYKDGFGTDPWVRTPLEKKSRYIHLLEWHHEISPRGVKS